MKFVYKNWILSFRRFCVKKRKVYHMNLTINSFKKNKWKINIRINVKINVKIEWKKSKTAGLGEVFFCEKG